MAGPMRTVSFKLPADLDRAISRLARSRKSTRSAVVRTALEAFTREGGGSVAALAERSGWLGRRVPAYYFTARKHMVGYGK